MATGPTWCAVPTAVPAAGAAVLLPSCAAGGTRPGSLGTGHDFVGAGPQLGALVIFTFMGAAWDSFIRPLLMLTTEETYTVPVAPNTLTGLTRVDSSGPMPGSLPATLPLLLFLLFQRQFVAGLPGGAVEG